MGAKKGLSVDGFNYFSNVLTNKQKPGWMDFSQQIAKLTGNYTMLDMVTGLQGLDSFLFKTHNWLIGSARFDGIMRTEHTSRIKATQYPVQSGVVMTDHAIIEPSELTIEIMMSDCHTKSFVSNNPVLDAMYQNLQSLALYSNYVQMETDMSAGEGRSARAWMTLKAMQISRVPIQVVTRLQTYNNMLIEELSAPDDVKTLNALKATVRLREIIVANVAETKVSARAAAAKQTKSGQTPAKVKDPNDTAANAIKEGLGF